MRLIDRFSHLLLDMNGTFMFREDRFGDGTDFFQAYRLLGGHSLSPREVEHHIRSCFDGLCQLYEDPDRIDDFPSLTEGFVKFSHAPEEELPILESVFTYHERGQVPGEYADCIRRLAHTHRLAIVANIWAPRDAWVAHLKEVGIFDCFDACLFSSDSRSMKPSPQLYNQALWRLQATCESSLFVGDSLRCDMEGAKNVGLTTVWITQREDHQDSVDYRVPSLLQLEELEI